MTSLVRDEPAVSSRSSAADEPMWQPRIAGGVTLGLGLGLGAAMIGALVRGASLRT